jgi:hypothetical protein
MADRLYVVDGVRATQTQFCAVVGFEWFRALANVAFEVKIGAQIQPLPRCKVI